MKFNQILGVGVRIAGIFLLVITIRNSPQWITTLKQSAMDPITGAGDYSYLYFFMGFTALTILIALVMIKFPSTVAKSLAKNFES